MVKDCPQIYEPTDAEIAEMGVIFTCLQADGILEQVRKAPRDYRHLADDLLKASNQLRRASLLAKGATYDRNHPSS